MHGILDAILFLTILFNFRDINGIVCFTTFIQIGFAYVSTRFFFLWLFHFRIAFESDTIEEVAYFDSFSIDSHRVMKLPADHR